MTSLANDMPRPQILISQRQRHSLHNVMLIYKHITALLIYIF